ncbi:MAG: type III PLP-dependent enzyme domain-containing protein [Aggregatilineales bacterium]
MIETPLYLNQVLGRSQPYQTDSPDSPVSPLPTLPRGFKVSNDRLFYKGLDVLALAESNSPVYVRHLPSLCANVAQLHEWFAAAKRRTKFPGTLTVAYASKANPAQPVVRTLLQTGTAYECSSAYDIQIVRHAAAQGWLDTGRTIFMNGFKLPAYARAAIDLRADGYAHVLPIFDGLDEIAPFAESGLTFDVGVRFCTDSPSDEVNRFGMDSDALTEAADRIAHTDTLRLTTFHAMQAIPAANGVPAYWAAVANSVRAYARLRRIVPTLERFDIGGGMPAHTAAVHPRDWLTQLLQTLVAVCMQENVPAPELIIESGRFLVQDHAFRLFHVVKSKSSADGVPYYLLDGSIMSALPDAWALGDSFTVLPINGWRGQFRPARLAGLTCDHDDIYPTNRMNSAPLLLPCDIENLVVGFFDCGAYQETLSGRGGAKHCMLPEAPEVIIDKPPPKGIGRITRCSGQDAASVLSSLGYTMRS